MSDSNTAKTRKRENTKNALHKYKMFSFRGFAVSRFRGLTCSSIEC